MPNKNITPFYNPNLSYEENCKTGPFGGFADGVVYENKNEPTYDFLGQKVYLPFGIPAGPIPNAKFCKGGFEKGFDIIMYKTVRTRSHPCNAFPNIVPVNVKGEKLTIEQAQAGLTMGEKFEDPIAITNSFGVPSDDPEQWIPDMTQAVKDAGKGQVLVATYLGTPGNGEEAFIQDWIDGAKMILQTGAPIVELDLSCPNEGKSSLLCHDTERVVKIVKAIQPIFEAENIPVLIKLSYFPSDIKLQDFIEKVSPYVAGFNAINTIAGDVRKENGEQALPGKGRLISGVCGAPIKWAGLEMVERMAKIRSTSKHSFIIIGTGGVTTPADYKEYISAGADAVMSATGAMWNTDLAKEIKAEIL